MTLPTLEEVRAKKAESKIEAEIAEVETRIRQKVVKQSTESVFIEGWGRFYRRGDGWHGPGGYYGPSAPNIPMLKQNDVF